MIHTGNKNLKRIPIMISLIIGVFFAILNETLLNVAYTDLMRDLEVPASTVQWLTTGFLLIVGISIPVTAFLIQWFTTRQLFLGAMILFAIGTFICGISPTFSTLLIGRLIQAAGTGLLIPIMMNTVLVLYPPEKRGSAMGMIGLVLMFAPAIGPTVSGFIVELFNWRWLFYLVLPFVLFSIFFAGIYLKNVTEATKPKIDVLSIVLSTLGFGGIVFGFSSAGKGDGGWVHPEVYLSVLVGVFALILFVWRQLKMKEPMLGVRAFTSPMFSLSIIVIMILMMTMFSAMIILPMFLQGPLALTALAAGLVLLPGGIINGLLSPVSGRLYDKFGPKFLVVPGALLIVIVMWGFTNISVETSVGIFVLLHCLLMVGVALVMTPAQTNGLNQLPRKYYPHGSAILNTLLQVSGAVGIAFYISLMSAGEARYIENVSGALSPNIQASAITAGIQYAFSFALGFAVIAFIITLFIKRSNAPVEEEMKEVS